MFALNPYDSTQMRSWNPFSQMEELEKHFFNNGFFGGHGLAEFKTDITDEGDAYQMKMDLPGFQKEDIHLDLEGNLLTVSAQRHSEHEEQDKQDKFVRCERSYGSYRRSFDLSGIQADGIHAKYEDGVLTLQLPKRAPELPAAKRLEIE